MEMRFCPDCGMPLNGGICPCRNRPRPPKKKSRWYIYVIIAVVAVLLIAAVIAAALLLLGGGAIFLFNKNTTVSKPATVQTLPPVYAPEEEQPAPTSSNVMVRPTQAPTEPAPEPVYLIDLPVVGQNGKLWTMSENPPSGFVHTDVTDGNAYLDTATPGHTTGPVYDYLGNRFTCGLFVDGATLDTYYVSYHLGGAYDDFTGKISISSDLAGTDSMGKYSKYVEIYADGELIYCSPTMAQGVGVQSFWLDVSDVQTLTILYPKTKGHSRFATVYDALLQ